MPHLSSLTLSPGLSPGPPARVAYAPEPAPAQGQPAAPAEATMQSWAAGDAVVRQPQPAKPVGSIWTPAMGIKFGGGPAEGQPGQPGQPGTWSPKAGIKFG